jgi:hypothetical protein
LQHELETRVAPSQQNGGIATFLYSKCKERLSFNNNTIQIKKYPVLPSRGRRRIISLARTGAASKKADFYISQRKLAGNYQLRDEESTREIGFHWELRAQGRGIHRRNWIPPGIAS